MLMSWLNVTMQNIHTLSKRILAAKHDPDICKNIFNIYVYTLCFQVTGKKCSTIFLSHLKHKPGILKIEFRFKRWKYGKKCQIAVEACVFLKSKKSQEGKRNGMLYLSCLVKELQFKLSKVQWILSQIVLIFEVVWTLNTNRVKNMFRIVLILVFIKKKSWGRSMNFC